MNKIKKAVIILILIGFLPVFGAEVLPYYINSLKRVAIGFTNVQSPLVLRKTPQEDGEILETVNFDFEKNVSCLVNKQRCSLEEVFSAYSTEKKIALLTTVDETQGWSLVCFNQSEKPVCGWAEEKKNKYYNWTDFFNIYGRKYGVYLFKDLQKTDKILYSAPLKQTNSVGTIDMPRKIDPWLIRGNWILVKVYDFNNQLKTGWINFRFDNGKLKLFVNF